MSEEYEKKTGTSFLTTALLLLLLVFFVTMIALEFMKGTEEVATSAKNKKDEVVFHRVTSGPVIDYNELFRNSGQMESLENRKDKYGIGDEVDVIVRTEETLKLGKNEVPMQEIIDQVRLKEGGLVEKDVTGDSARAADQINEFGVYIVKSGDNIWNIHFDFLKKYFANKNIMLSPAADEPTRGSRSSGVGKLLKFSERMVYIYSVTDHKLASDINIIHPQSKIVVYNMGEVYNLLERIDYSMVDEIHFDGETIWIPSEK